MIEAMEQTIFEKKVLSWNDCHLFRICIKDVEEHWEQDIYEENMQEFCNSKCDAGRLDHPSNIERFVVPLIHKVKVHVDRVPVNF